MEKEIAIRLWPEHAELCSDHDWNVLSDLVSTNRPPSQALLEPKGEAKDAFLTSLLILYWTMKIAHLALQISREVSHLHGREKANAIFSKVTGQLDEHTPRKVYDRVMEIIEQLPLT